jgi:8-oxo-dGTP pyrophosphatase MutT (NUDIX family)
MNEYSLGFLFDINKKFVLLVERQKNDWQKGLINGIGGAQEESENTVGCMIREFEEETTIHTSESDWVHFCNLISYDCYVGCFFSYYSHDFHTDFENINTKEKIIKVKIKEIFNYKCIPNVYWLIPMALSHSFRNYNIVTVDYRKPLKND